jgi:replicative DNA helicase
MSNTPTSANGHANGAPTQPTENRQPSSGHALDGQNRPKPETARLVNFGELLREFGDDAQAANEARISGKPRGPISGLPSLDRELSGAWLPGLHWIHGNAGAGKTAFALQVAATCGAPALFVSCEMAPVELLRRHTARATGTFLGRLKSGELTRQSAETLARDAIASAPRLCLADATRAPAPVQFLSDAAQIAQGDDRHLLIVVDSLHSWAARLAPELDEYKALNAGIMDLQTLSSALNCPILIVSERNRAGMESGGQSAGAGTRKIEYSGDTVISLQREQSAKENGAGEVEIKLVLSKNRHNAQGKSLDLRFNGALQRFTESRF